MARITEATRELLRKKILEKSQDKRDALAGEIEKLSNCLDAEADKMKAKAIARIKEEFDTFNENVANILKGYGLKWRRQYSYDYTVEDIIGDSCGVAYIKDDINGMFERVKDDKDRVVKRLDNLRIDLKELDAKRSKACEDIELRVALGAKFDEMCEDIELRVALGAKFDEVVELINNLQF